MIPLNGESWCAWGWAIWGYTLMRTIKRRAFSSRDWNTFILGRGVVTTEKNYKEKNVLPRAKPNTSITYLLLLRWGLLFWRVVLGLLVAHRSNWVTPLRHLQDLVLQVAPASPWTDESNCLFLLFWVLRGDQDYRDLFAVGDLIPASSYLPQDHCTCPVNISYLCYYYLNFNLLWKKAI